MQNCRLTFLPVVAGLTAILSLGTASADDLFVSNNGNNTVDKISSTGVVSVFATTDLSGPTGLAFDNTGDLFVANNNTGAIEEFSATTGALETTFVTGLNNPRGLVYNNVTGDLYVANQSTGTVDQITLGGVVTTLATGFSAANGLAVDNLGNIYVASGTGDTISKITPGGITTTFASNPSGNLNNPNGLAFGPNGKLFVVDKDAPAIEEFTVGGGSNSIFSTAGLDGAESLVFDSAGNLYVTNSLNNTITEYNSNGVESVFATDLDYPCYVTVDPLVSTPEPSTYALLAVGLSILLFMSRRKLARA